MSVSRSEAASARPGARRAASRAPRPPRHTATRSVFICPLEKIVPQKGQPRQHFDAQKLEELAASIREHGLLEPLVVRRAPGSDKFELIAGERRWRALQKAGLREALVVVKDVSAEDAFELALIENVQREDLNAIELAEALERLHATSTATRRRRSPAARQGPHDHRQRASPAQAAAARARARSSPASSPKVTPARCSAPATPPPSTSWPKRSSAAKLSVRATEALVRARPQSEGQAQAERRTTARAPRCATSRRG